MASTDNRFGFTENDTGDALLLRYKDKNGDAIDVTGYRIFLKIGYDKPLVKEAVISDASSGTFLFSFAYGDLRHGSYETQLMFRTPDGKESSTEGPYLDIKRRIRGTP